MVPMSRTLFGCSLALMIFMAIWSGTAVAVTRVDLYSETVEVEARDYAARLKGYQEALARVLVRSTGRRDIANEAGIAGLVKGANRLVLQYRFLEDGRMNVSFDGPVIERFLSSNKLTLWSRERPKTLIWLAMDNGAGARTLVGGEQAAQAKEFLEGLAQVRGMPVEKALTLLTFSNKKAAVLVRKVLESAIANAEHNDGADIDELKVSSIFVDVGPSMKRMRARAKGRGNRIVKRTSHITVTVADS